MTEPQRVITGLQRRSSSGARSVTGDLSALQAKNRNAPASATPSEPAQQVEPEKKPSNKSMTVYVAQDVYTQARLAFNATRTAESDRNWSHFVEKAIAEETRRRAALHNDGDAFDGVDAPLSPGRPLSED